MLLVVGVVFLCVIVFVLFVLSFGAGASHCCVCFCWGFVACVRSVLLLLCVFVVVSVCLFVVCVFCGCCVICFVVLYVSVVCLWYLCRLFCVCLLFVVSLFVLCFCV